MVRHELLATHKYGRRKRGQEFENFSKKKTVFLV